MSSETNTMALPPAVDVKKERQFLVDAGVLLSSHTIADELALLRAGVLDATAVVLHDYPTSNLTEMKASDPTPTTNKHAIDKDTSITVSPSKTITTPLKRKMLHEDIEMNMPLVRKSSRTTGPTIGDTSTITSHTKPFTFLGLPSEIHAKIIEEIFVGEMIEIMNWIPKGVRRKWEYLDFATVTVVNKQLRAESLRVFRKCCNIYIPDVMRAYCTVNKSLCCRNGLFDGNLLQKITIDYIPEHVSGWPSAKALLCDFPSLRSLTVKCLITDAFDWTEVDWANYHLDHPNTTGRALGGSLTNSAQLRDSLFGKMMCCKTKLAQAVQWAEEGLEGKPQLCVFVRMRVYANVSAGIQPREQTFGTLVANVRKQQLWYLGSGRQALVELEGWTREPLDEDVEDLKLMQDRW